MTIVSMFPTQAWKNIKEFAGIYSITTEWYQARNLPIDELCFLARELFSFTLPDAAWNWSKRKQRLCILSAFVRSRMDKAKYCLLEDLFPNTKKYTIGGEVYRPDTYDCGIITSIQGDAIVIAPYMKTHDYQNKTLVWSKQSFQDKSTIRIRRGGTNPIIKSDLASVSDKTSCHTYGVNKDFTLCYM